MFISKLKDAPSDENLEQEYTQIRDVLNTLGYTETSELQFESSENPMSDIAIMDIKELLEELGVSYSRELEVDVIKELSVLKGESNQTVSKEKYELVKHKKNQLDFKYSEPEIGEKISLYFYLFLEFGFTSVMKPVIQLGGDFKDSLDYDDRNYLRIVKSDFIRVFDDNNPGSIVLSSCKTQEDFVRESGLLYSGFFIHQKREEVNGVMTFKEEKNVYRLIEVRKFLSPNQPVVVEVNKIGYDTLIRLSSAIKKEMVLESNKMISVDEIKIRAKDLVSSLTLKIDELLANEDFESIIKIKQDIDFINSKVKLVEDSNKLEITTEEYFKIFHMP